MYKYRYRLIRSASTYPHPEEVGLSPRKIPITGTDSHVLGTSSKLPRRRRQKQARAEVDTALQASRNFLLQAALLRARKAGLLDPDALAEAA